MRIVLPLSFFAIVVVKAIGGGGGGGGDVGASVVVGHGK
jgi:hypothetical protein